MTTFRKLPTIRPSSREQRRRQQQRSGGGVHQRQRRGRGARRNRRPAGTASASVWSCAAQWRHGLEPVRIVSVTAGPSPARAAIFAERTACRRPKSRPKPRRFRVATGRGAGDDRRPAPRAPRPAPQRRSEPCRCPMPMPMPHGHATATTTSRPCPANPPRRSRQVKSGSRPRCRNDPVAYRSSRSQALLAFLPRPAPSIPPDVQPPSAAARCAPADRDEPLRRPGAGSSRR